MKKQNNEFNDLVQEEQKISMDNFRDFFYELKKVHDSILWKYELEISDLKKQNRILANMAESKDDFIRNELAKLKSQHMELNRLFQRIED
jgi:hypothetical protein